MPSITRGSVIAAATMAALGWKNPAALLEAMESARAGALLESLENRHAMRTAVVPDSLIAVEREAQSRVRMARLRFQNALASGVLPSIRRARQELDLARDGLHDAVGRIQLHAKAAASVLYPRPTPLGQLQGTLPEGAALVVYSLVAREAAALVVTREAARIVELGASDALRKEAAASLDDLRGGGEEPFAALRARLVTPLELPASVRRVIVSPDDVLGYVPFGAILEGRVASYVPSGTAWSVLREQRGPLAGHGVLAVGDPDYRQPQRMPAGSVRRGGVNLSPLPATRAEAKQVGDVVLLAGEATPEGVLGALATRERWRALHLACHGLLDAEQPMNSALALSYGAGGDNLLTGLDVVRGRVPADLAVLSACETGKGRIYRSEGIVGLTQAFMLAGAPRVIVSLWKVDDEATQALMVRFYELWNPAKGKGLPAAEALAEAQAFVRSQERWRRPHYWAAWVLWGLPD